MKVSRQKQLPWMSRTFFLYFFKLNVNVGARVLNYISCYLFFPPSADPIFFWSEDLVFDAFFGYQNQFSVTFDCEVCGLVAISILGFVYLHGQVTIVTRRHFLFPAFFFHLITRTFIYFHRHCHYHSCSHILVSSISFCLSYRDHITD